MPDDPALTYRGPESASQNILVIRFDGTAINARGVLMCFETTVGEADKAFANARPVAWIAYDGDESQIEFVQYTEAATGQAVHRRVIKAERVSSQWNTVKLNLVSEATVIAQQADFSSVDFDPRDFAT